MVPRPPARERDKRLGDEAWRRHHLDSAAQLLDQTNRIRVPTAAIIPTVITATIPAAALAGALARVPAAPPPPRLVDAGSAVLCVRRLCGVL